MGEKAKNVVMDILKSNDMREYFEEILRGQTNEIVSSFQKLEEIRLNDDIQELKKKLTEEQEKSNGLRLKNQELERENDHLKKYLKIKNVIVKEHYNRNLRQRVK